MISPVKVWRNQKSIVNNAGKTGTVLSYTVIRVPAAEFSSQAPHAVAVISLPEGRKITLQVVDLKDFAIKIGDRVRLVVRRIREPGEDGIIPYGLKAIRI